MQSPLLVFFLPAPSYRLFCWASLLMRLVLESNLPQTFKVTNALLALYSDRHQFSSSVQLFNTMSVRNVVSWNTLISGYAHNGDVEKATAVLHQMHKDGMELDLVTLISILPVFSERKDLSQGMAIHGFAIKNGIASDVSLLNAPISMYCYCRDFEAGRSHFEVMPQRNVVSWNALITGCRYHNLQNEVLVLFSHMIREDQAKLCNLAKFITYMLHTFAG